MRDPLRRTRSEGTSLARRKARLTLDQAMNGHDLALALALAFA